MKVAAALLLSTVSASAADFCVFPIVGQSNAAGNGIVSESVIVPFPVANWNNGPDIVAGNDPLCSTCGGSPWPAFGSEFYNRTGKSVVFVQTAIGGGILSSALAAHYGVTAHWGATGTLVASAFSKIDAVLARLAYYGVSAQVCGVDFDQGPSEAQAIVDVPGVTSAADWTSEFNNLVGRFRAKYRSDLPFFVNKIGTMMQAGAPIKEAGFSAIRGAQEAVQSDPRVLIVSRLSLQCAARGQMMTDGVAPNQFQIHYNQTCNNLLGREAGAEAANSGLWK